MTSSFRPAQLDQTLGTNYAGQARKAIQDVSNQTQVRDEVARRNNLTDVQNARMVNKTNAEAFNALASFSKSIETVVADIRKRKKENEIAEGKALVLEGKITEEDLVQYYADERALEEEKKRRDKIGGEAALNGAPYEATSRLRNLTKWQQHAAVQMITKQVASKYESELENSFQTDNTTKYLLPNGKRLTPVEARQGSRAEQQAMRAILKNEYLKKTGLIGISDEILVDQAQDLMASADAKVDATNARLFAINDSSIQLEASDNKFLVDFDPNAALSRTIGRMTEDGVITRSMALDRLFKNIARGRQKGPNGEPPMISDAQYELIKDAVVEGGNKGEKWGKKLALRFREIEDLKAKSDAAAYDFKEKQRMQLFEQRQRDMIAAIGNKGNKAEYDLAIDSLRREAQFDGLSPNMLIYERDTNSVQARAEEAQRKELQSLADRGLLTTNVLSKYSYKLRTAFATAAEAGDKFMLPEVKGYANVVKTFLEKETATVPGGNMPDTAQILQPIINQRFQNRFLELSTKMAPSSAAAQAWKEIKTEMVAEKFNKESIYYKDSTGYPNVLPSTVGAATTAKALNHDLNILNARISGGKAGLSKYEYRNKEHLQEREKNYGKPGWTHDPLFVYIGSKLNVNPLTVENLQRERVGLKPLALPKAMNVVEDNVRPEFKQFLNRYQSQNRTTRALSTMGWQPAIVPNDMGETVQEVAQKNNIEPSLLAAVVENRGDWSAEAVNALGGQLGLLREQNGGSINSALASLSGYASADDPDFKSTYLSPILKAAVKYGGKSILSNPAIMRGQFRVIEHLSGDKGHSSYRADHGGDNYHEHLAFATQAERDAAMAKLKAAGIQIGSVYRDDTGYHGKNLAFDVPASQVPPGKEAELSRRVREILGIK